MSDPERPATVRDVAQLVTAGVDVIMGTILFLTASAFDMPSWLPWLGMAVCLVGVWQLARAQGAWRWTRRQEVDR